VVCLQLKCNPVTVIFNYLQASYLGSLVYNLCTLFTRGSYMPHKNQSQNPKYMNVDTLSSRRLLARAVGPSCIASALHSRVINQNVYSPSSVLFSVAIRWEIMSATFVIRQVLRHVGRSFIAGLTVRQNSRHRSSSVGYCLFDISCYRWRWSSWIVTVWLQSSTR